MQLKWLDKIEETIKWIANVNGFENILKCIQFGHNIVNKWLNKKKIHFFSFDRNILAAIFGMSKGYCGHSLFVFIFFNFHLYWNRFTWNPYVICVLSAKRKKKKKKEIQYLKHFFVIFNSTRFVYCAWHIADIMSDSIERTMVRYIKLFSFFYLFICLHFEKEINFQYSQNGRVFGSFFKEFICHSMEWFMTIILEDLSIQYTYHNFFFHFYCTNDSLITANVIHIDINYHRLK